jgi:hypothetical protein
MFQSELLLRQDFISKVVPIRLPSIKLIQIRVVFQLITKRHAPALPESSQIFVDCQRETTHKHVNLLLIVVGSHARIGLVQCENLLERFPTKRALHLCIADQRQSRILSPSTIKVWFCEIRFCIVHLISQPSIQVFER